MFQWIRSFFFNEDLKDQKNRTVSLCEQDLSLYGAVTPRDDGVQFDDMRVGEDNILIKPLSPHRQWKPDNLENCFDQISADQIKCKELNQLLFNLEKSFDVPSVLLENELIFKDVSEMVDQTFQTLDRKYPLFKDSIVHKVGSVGEGTKVGIFSEFDFMIELPALEKPLLKEVIPFKNENDPSNCVRMSGLNFLLEFMSDTKFTGTNLETNNETTDVFGKMKLLVFNEMKSVMRPSWGPGPNFRIADSEDKGKVRTIRLRKTREDKSHIDVFLDFSFCVPFIWTPAKRRFFKRSGTKEELAVTNHHMYRLLVRNGPFWTATAALREKDKLVNSPTSCEVKRVYRLSKMIIKTYLPPIYDFKLDTFEELIPSYWIKQILLFMMDYFPNSSSWNEDALGVRLYEIFFQLQFCLEKGLLANYFVPMNNYMLDNNKSEVTNLAHKFVPVLSQLLRTCVLGNEKALDALGSLQDLTRLYRETVEPKSKRMRLLFLLLRYKGLVKHQRFFVENTKFFSRVTEADHLFSILLEYLHYHSDDILIKGRGRALRICENGNEHSLEDFVKLIRDDPLGFPDDWEAFYTGLCAENLPIGMFQFGKPRTGQLQIGLGEIVRKTFRDKPQKLSMADEFALTLNFMVD